MEEEFRRVMIDALTEALEKGMPVTIKNSGNSSLIAITATEGKIIMSLSKIPNMLDDLIHILSDALGAGPDLIYNRASVIKQDFLIYYAVWITSVQDSQNFIEHEFAMGQNHITFMSNKAIGLIKDAKLALEDN
jgi:hypothetical protein